MIDENGGKYSSNSRSLKKYEYSYQDVHRRNMNGNKRGSCVESRAVWKRVNTPEAGRNCVLH